MGKRSENLKRVFLIFFILSFLIFVPFISSYDLKIPTNETACNITISFSNSTDFLVNKVMTLNNGYANYTFNPSSSIYNYFSNCGYGTININGENLTSAQSILYFLVTLFAFFVFVLVTYIFISIEGENPRNEKGYFSGINYKKYIKISMFPLVYISFLWFFNFIIGLSTNYLQLTLYAETLGFIFMVLTKGIYVILVLTIIVLGVRLIQDSNIKEEYKSLWNQY